MSEDRHFLREDHTIRHFSPDGRLVSSSHRQVCYCGWRTPRFTDPALPPQYLVGHLGDPSAPEDSRVDL